MNFTDVTDLYNFSFDLDPLPRILQLYATFL